MVSSSQLPRVRHRLPQVAVASMEVTGKLDLVVSPPKALNCCFFWFCFKESLLLPAEYKKVQEWGRVGKRCLGMRMLEWDSEGVEGHVDTFIRNHGDWQDLANLIFLFRGIFKLNFILASPLLGQFDRGFLLSLKCSSCYPPDGKVQGV